ncbi:HMA2 domain-containing protein [Janthinobacterium fluminis]|uniref:Heavy-metal-associated domain-containing protein n=1 Tax=Janthinobacterium fluminis TaxID=2987524 RepID=A0ABT5JUV4_9BURK|nr:hypothetical protein [Janthinobacterium fluminis]MDC8756526.1 hypothetical protein [Janthinobacterium fluminis]
MSTNAVVVHQLPGRVRLSIPEKRGDDDYFRLLSRRFSGLEGVRNVKTNALAGSIVLEFNGHLQEVLRRAGAPALFDLDGAAGGMRPALPARPLNLVTGRELNPMFMAGVLFSAVGLLQSIRGRLMVPAVTAFWYATSTFQQAGVTIVMDAAAGVGEGDGD